MSPSPTRPPTAAAVDSRPGSFGCRSRLGSRESGGTVPSWPEGAARPAVEVERPADPGPRRLRQQPRDEARPAVPDGAARDRGGPRRRADAERPTTTRPRRRSRPPRSRRPASSTCGCATTRSRRRSPRSSPTRPAGAASRRSAPRSVNVEFVSANPTGPLHVGNARGAFIGDLLSRVLEAGGQHVTREYYFNDSGGQIRNLGASVAALRRGEPVPEDGYQGDYVDDLAAALPDDVWAAATAAGADTDGDRRPLGGRPGPRGDRGAASPALGVHFDVWTSEARLHDEGWVARAVERLRERGHVYEQDGAVWFRSTAFGDDKDRVIYPLERRADLLRRRHRLRDREVQPRLRPPHLHLGRRPPRDGRPRPQRRRGDGLRPRGRPGPALLVGPLRPRRRGGLDEQAGRRVHHPRRAAGRGRRRRRPLVLRVTRGDDRDRLRHRAGQEAVEREPGLLRPVRARPDRLDPAQGGRGRAGARGRTWPGALAGAPEAALARAIVRFPEVVEDAVAAEETQGITAYATELATTFHGFYRDARVVDADEPERSAARLALAEAARITLANALALLGISAPESM